LCFYYNKKGTPCACAQRVLKKDYYPSTYLLFLAEHLPALFLFCLISSVDEAFAEKFFYVEINVKIGRLNIIL